MYYCQHKHKLTALPSWAVIGLRASPPDGACRLLINTVVITRDVCFFLTFLLHAAKSPVCFVDPWAIPGSPSRCACARKDEKEREGGGERGGGSYKWLKSFTGLSSLDYLTALLHYLASNDNSRYTAGRAHGRFSRNDNGWYLWKQHFSETEVRTNPDKMDLRDSTSLVIFEVLKIWGT